MERYENHNLEFKEIYVPEIKKEVIAFANTDGGVLYLGVRNDGKIVGVTHPDEVMLQVASALNDAIRPDVMSFVKIRTVLREEKPLVEITVEAGSGRPYYLAEKGLKPSGVYVRKGSATQPLSDDGIREMILQSSGRSYEKSRSMNQNLTFSTLEREMAKRNQEIGPTQMRTLHLIGEDGLYTNLALLLSDQCEHTIKVAIFQGIDKAMFRDRKDFCGSLLEQLNESYQLIDLWNKTKASFSGLERTDKRDYPEEAIREALLNSIVHRDYSFTGSTLINLYDDRIEFISLGDLVSGLSMEAVFMGVSQSRNPYLASVFYRIRLIESYGTGIGKIIRLYRDEARQPQFDTAKGVFRVLLPNRNEGQQALQETGRISETVQIIVDDPKQAIYRLAEQKGSIRRKDVEELLGLKSTRAFTFLKDLCREGALLCAGSGRNSRYLPVKG